ncbi:hypothetical protein [Myxosarcina sp. GI1]|uniref:PFE-CTERM domain-containing protein n=1 Tax=Myxosarcina sp. GI1 TaxID=1541065 RepID=UPI0005672517|nr:hypothetical protein [Myxosarcina sp. GI1]
MNSTKIKKVIIFTGLTVAYTIIFQHSVRAFQFTFDEASSDVANGTYVYDINLEDGESLSSTDPANDLNVYNLAEVTNVFTDSAGPYTLSEDGGFDEISASLTVTNEDYSTTDNIVTIESTITTPGPIDYLGNSEGGATPSYTGSTLGPSVQAVPFEFSPSQGLFLVAGFWGLFYYRKHRKKRIANQELVSENN